MHTSASFERIDCRRVLGASYAEEARTTFTNSRECGAATTPFRQFALIGAGLVPLATRHYCFSGSWHLIGINIVECAAIIRRDPGCVSWEGRAEDRQADQKLK